MNDKLVHRILAIGTFVVSFTVYGLTMAPTVSFWDCGEFIACAFKLAVPHPPGAPLYLLVGRIFTLLPIFEDIARRVNFISVISSAFSVLFLYLIIVHFIKGYLGTKEGFFKYIPSLGGAIGALTFAFTNSFWFNAVESEVYAPSMLFTSLVVWLILRWSERSKEIGNEKYLLLIAYLMGLAIGVHLLNVLTLPMVVMIIFYKRYELNMTNMIYMALTGVFVTAMVYPGIVKGVPRVASLVGFIGLLLLILGFIFAFYWAVNNRKNIISILLMSILLLVLGYSSYMMVYIRSNLDPNIDENDPETIEEFISYLNREQYGEHYLDRTRAWQESRNKKQYSSAREFFWRYQVNEMYVRYFLWNFVGKDSNKYISQQIVRTMERRGVDWKKFFGIPLILGLMGAYYHFSRDWKHALAVFTLFFMTGLAIILYLNQLDPQPRERDYSYVGSFFAFSIWIGIGVAAILEWFTQKFHQFGSFVPAAMAFVLFFLSPLQLLTKNYHEQDRTGNYVAWDYSYNMLVACEPNGILFTNGDNDTFPLWYLQEVENIRPDVRVANLSLLNTNWYILQLKHKEPKVPISLSDSEIDRIFPVPWPKKQKIELNLPAQVASLESKEYQRKFNIENINVPKKMVFELGPKLFGQYLRVQDYMILNILFANRFRKPIYFGVTVARENMLDGLQKYLRMDGSVLRITTLPEWTADPERLYENLMKKFKFRNLNNPDVFLNDNITGLIQNYRSAFFELAKYYLIRKDTLRFKEIVNRVYEVMPPDIVPYTNRTLKQYMEGIGFLAGVRNMDSLNAHNYSPREMQGFGELGMILHRWDFARVAFERLLKAQPDNLQIKGYLVNVYGRLKEYDLAIKLLEEWLQKNPEDKAAKRRLEEYTKLRNQSQKKTS